MSSRWSCWLQDVVVSRFVIDNRWLKVSGYAFFSPFLPKRWKEIIDLLRFFWWPFAVFCPCQHRSQFTAGWSPSNFWEGRRKRSNGRGRIHAMMPAEVEWRKGKNQRKKSKEKKTTEGDHYKLVQLRLEQIHQVKELKNLLYWSFSIQPSSSSIFIFFFSLTKM